MRWRAWYQGGAEYASSTADWKALPRDGCVIVKWWPAEGPKHLECGADSIIRVGDEFVSVNLPTPEFALTATFHALAGDLKFGVYLPPEEYAAIYERALAAEAPEA